MDLNAVEVPGCRYARVSAENYFGSEESSAAVIRRKRKLPGDGADHPTWNDFPAESKGCWTNGYSLQTDSRSISLRKLIV